MKISFLGTAAAEGVPSLFCNCEYCNNIRKKGASEFRSRTQVMIDGKLCIDFPPEAYSNSLKYGYNFSALQYLLVTHSHMDHFYAHDFILRGYKYAKLAAPVLEIYGNEEVRAVYGECTAREMKAEVAPNLKFNLIAPYSKLKVGAYDVMAIPAQHSKTEDALLFYISDGKRGYLHLHDTGRICDKALDFLKDNGAKAHVVAFDCTFVEQTAGEISRHMGIEDDMVIKEKLLSRGIIDKDTKIIITHFSHNANPTRERLKGVEEKYGVVAAYDGMEVDI